MAAITIALPVCAFIHDGIKNLMQALRLWNIKIRDFKKVNNCTHIMLHLKAFHLCKNYLYEKHSILIVEFVIAFHTS